MKQERPELFVEGSKVTRDILEKLENDDYDGLLDEAQNRTIKEVDHEPVDEKFLDKKSEVQTELDLG